jgi:hypothetical protein
LRLARADIFPDCASPIARKRTDDAGGLFVHLAGSIYPFELMRLSLHRKSLPFLPMLAPVK